jgi:hypothetical protein
MYLEFLAPTKTRISIFQDKKVLLTHKKILIEFSVDDPFFAKYNIKQDLHTWILHEIEFKHDEEKSKFEINLKDPFTECVLLAIFLRKNFNF